jgi:hypothetical protein
LQPGCCRTGTQVELGAGLDEREERGPEADLERLAEEVLGEGHERGLEVGHLTPLVDVEALDLVEHRAVGRVVVAAEGRARGDDADRRLRVRMVRIWTGEVCVRRTSSSPSRPKPAGAMKKVSAMSRAGWSLPMLRSSKL